MNIQTIFSLTLYGFSAVISFTGFLIFSWWWYNQKNATKIYAYVTLLLFSISVEQFIDWLAYYYLIIDEKICYHIMRSHWWYLRELLISSVMLAVVVHVSHRIAVQRRRTQMFKARRRTKPDNYFKQEILVVDDKDEVVNLLIMGINQVFPNVTVYSAMSAEEALKIFAEHENINLVITDMFLPKMNGFELCSLIKEECPWTIIIGMTGYINVYEFWVAREVGFDDYVTKPFHLNDITSIVRKHLEVLDRWKSIRAGRGKPSEPKRVKEKE